MNAESISMRTPKPAYQGQNGYQKEFTEAEHNIEAAIRAHKQALFFIDHQQREVPNLETMKEEIEKPENSQYLSQQIASLRKQHTKDLEQFYAMKATEYEDDVKERYRSTDPNATTKKDLVHDYVIQADWNDHMERMRYTYLSRLLLLQKKHRDCLVYEENERQKQLMSFPQSKEDFDTKTPEMQLRVARFLAATDEKMREKLISKFNWAWRQTSSLLEEFKKDEVFAARIRSMVIAETSVSDPRRPRPSTSTT